MTPSRRNAVLRICAIVTIITATGMLMRHIVERDAADHERWVQDYPRQDAKRRDQDVMDLQFIRRGRVCFAVGGHSGYGHHDLTYVPCELVPDARDVGQ